MISYVPFGITIDEPKRSQKLYIIVVVSCRLANDSWQTIYQALWQTTGLKRRESGDRNKSTNPFPDSALSTGVF